MPRHVPSSTYRLQLHKDFPLFAARDIVSYLAKLGIGAVYTSPYFTAEPGSTHGYDVCNHNEINPELGGSEAHDAFVAAVMSHQMGHVIDFVPNHMGIGKCMNPWWRDVLENGPGAASAVFFDVDWTPVKPELRAKLLVPILGDQYGNVLTRGELQLVFHDGALSLTYFDNQLPINPREAARVYRSAVDPLKETVGPDDAKLHEFLSIVSSLENMPVYTESDAGRAAERQREKEVARGRLERLVAESREVAEQIDAAVKRFNGEAGKPDSFDALHDLLEAQPYRLAYWRTASHEINYRRFFDINTLAGLRVELPEVFETTHRLLATLLRENKITGVRLDHPDGLFDPARYFADLQKLAAEVWNCARAADGDPRCLYVVVEKILSGNEELPGHWAVHGTTGYNYLNDLNGLFVSSTNAKRMRRVYARLTGRAERFDDVLYATKRLIISTAMASELSVLAHMLDRIGESNRKSRDFTLDSMREVITEVVACFPVYRTYVDENGWTPEDRAIVEQAITIARRRNPAMESTLFDFFREVMLPRDVEPEPRPDDRRGGYPPATAEEARERLRFAMKLQQYTGPVQAKGLEDTAFYRYNVLLSLNEVGGDPSAFGRSVEHFHAANARRLSRWPCEMLATMTHDTKLGEDVRARINVLSEIPDEWGREVSKWMRLNRAHRTLVDGEPAPDRNDEYRLYQALVGAWPAECSTSPPRAASELADRLQAYMLKAVRESKVYTSWITPNDAYEDALRQFVDRVLRGAPADRFLRSMLPFQRRIAELGVVNSLAQTTLKVGSPGVPDFYQGTDLWELSLVDPDNRRPVDFSKRQEFLDDVLATLNAEPAERSNRMTGYLRSWPDGRIKLAVAAAGLRLRREHPDLFLKGRYIPLQAQSVVDGSMVAFARALDDAVAVFVAPRLCAALPREGAIVPLGADCWKTSRVLLPPDLASRTYRHVLTGAEVRPTVTGSEAWLFAGQIFETVPVGMLVAVQ